MSRPSIPRIIGLYTLTVFGVHACGAPSSDSLRTADTAAVSDSNALQESGEVDPELVGVWRGYWSPKGCVRTESHTLSPEGQWRWKATYPDAERTADQVAERIGRWGRRGSVLVLVEEGYRELLGCRGGSDGAGETGKTPDPACDEPRYRDVRHPSPVVKELALGECPPNREAEALDASYLCRSIGGQAFWRQAMPDEKAAGPATEQTP